MEFLENTKLESPLLKDLLKAQLQYKLGDYKNAHVSYTKLVKQAGKNFKYAEQWEVMVNQLAAAFYSNDVNTEQLFDQAK